ncbi:MAG TPA: LysR family transcriptional regulator [Steroidobacteraceae bacterium]
MEFQQLRHLVAAVDCGNLFKAARECGISQSGLSRSIHSLEIRLGVELLTRKAKGVEPTIYGRSVVQRARLILNEVNRSVEDLRALQAAKLGDVTVGVTQNYAHYLIPQVLIELYSNHPEVQVTVVTGGFLDLVEQLTIGAIDFAFGLLGKVEQSSEVRIEALREHFSKVVARSTHLFASQTEEITPIMLASARWATLRSIGFQHNFADYFISRNLQAPIQVLKTDSISMIKRLVASTDLLTVLPAPVVHDDIEAGFLTILDCEAPAEQSIVALMFRSHGLITPQSQLIIDRIRKQFRT